MREKHKLSVDKESKPREEFDTDLISLPDRRATVLISAQIVPQIRWDKITRPITEIAQFLRHICKIIVFPVCQKPPIVLLHKQSLRSMEENYIFRTFQPGVIVNWFIRKFFLNRQILRVQSVIRFQNRMKRNFS